jgi:tRNA A-37 threonylcarbamoyl transferase component Bud32
MPRETEPLLAPSSTPDAAPTHDEAGADASSGPLSSEVTTVSPGVSTAATVIGVPATLVGQLGAPRERFFDEGLFARGGMSAIHRVFDRSLRRTNAVKHLDAQLVTDEGSRRRFLAEAQVTGQLEHPSIVPVHDIAFGDDTTPPSFSMRLVRGDTLGSRIAESKASERTDSELRELLSILLRVCEAVDYAHQRGVTHRDLKPENIMLGAHGEVYVMDWGIARVHASGGPEPVTVDALPEEEGSLLGTPAYMAPEQAWGRVSSIDARTDVYALGGILYQILTGQPPHRGQNPNETLAAARAGKVKPPHERLGGQVPPRLAAIAMRALSADRSARHASARELADAIDDALRAGLWLGERTYAAGEVVVVEGDSGDEAFIITAGSAEASKGIDGERHVLRSMGVGEVFGEMALLGRRPRTATVIATERLSVLVVTREALAREMHGDSWLARLVQTLVNRFVALEANLESGSQPRSAV